MTDLTTFPEPSRTHPLPFFSSIETAPRVTKGWGHEVILVNLDYCGKLLCFNQGARFSMHMHDLKRESFWCSKGSLEFTYIDTADGREHVKVLKEGDIVHIPRLLPHRLHALEDSVIVEFSTHDERSDSLRVSPGDSQKSCGQSTS